MDFLWMLVIIRWLFLSVEERKHKTTVMSWNAGSWACWEVCLYDDVIMVFHGDIHVLRNKKYGQENTKMFCITADGDQQDSRQQQGDE